MVGTPVAPAAAMACSRAPLVFVLSLLVSSLGVACSSSSSEPAPNADVGVDAAPDTVTEASSDDGPSDASPDAPESGACVSGLTQPQPECQACQDAHCCIVASDCATTKSKWSCTAAKICRETSCATECATPPATCGNIVPDPASCTDATRAACCAELTACSQSDECLALIYICIDEQACDPTKPCFKDCKTKWPSGAAVFTALDKCASKVSCP